jgi:hypothetical protein
MIYLPNLAVELQKLILMKEVALKDHIHECAESGLSIIPRLFRDLANEFYRAKEDYKPIGKN